MSSERVRFPSSSGEVLAGIVDLPEGEVRARALDHLYQGQSNDCYWHGLFGGIYISHMRLATYEHLIAAEDLADRASGRDHVTERLDLEGLTTFREPRGRQARRDREPDVTGDPAGHAGGDQVGRPEQCAPRPVPKTNDRAFLRV